MLSAENNEVFKRVIILALETGLRRGEIIVLRWCGVDFDNRLVHVRGQMKYYKSFEMDTFEYHWESTKAANSIRDIPMTKKCTKALKEQKEYRDMNKATDAKYKNLVFLSAKNTPLNTRSFNRHLESLRVESGIGTKKINAAYV